jgi:hypothetical protein
MKRMERNGANTAPLARASRWQNTQSLIAAAMSKLHNFTGLRAIAKPLYRVKKESPAPSAVKQRGFLNTKMMLLMWLFAASLP